MKRWLTLMLVLALCAAPIAGSLSALAEELPGDVEVATDIVPAGAEALEGTGLVPDDDATEAFTPAQPEETPDEAPAETPAEIAAAPTLEGYYAVAAQAANVYEAAGAAAPVATLKQGDVVLVLGLDETGNYLRAAFNTSRGVIVGVVAASDLVQLTGDALDAALNAIGENVTACYQDDINYPLAMLDCAFPEGTTEEPTEVASENAEQTEVESPEKTEADGTTPENEPAAAEQVAQPEAAIPAEPAAQSEELPAEQSQSSEEVAQPEAAPAEEPASVETTNTEEAAPAEEAASVESTTTEEAASVVEPASVEAPAQPEAAPAEEPAPETGGEAYAVAAAEPAGPPTDFWIPAALTLGQKESYMLLTPVLVPENSVATFTWRSSKPKVVEVDPNTGALVAKKRGTATIFATTDNGIERSCAVTVVKAPKSVALNETRVVLMGGGQTFQLAATLSKNSGGTLYFTSSNPEVVSVSATGLLTSAAPGSATVTARTFNNKTAECVVSVLDPSVPQPASVALPATEFTIGVKQSLGFAPTMFAGDGANLGTTEFTVESSAPKKLKVNADNTVTGAKKGDYTVRVIAYNGVSTTAIVHVVKAPGKVAIAPADPIIGVGQTRQLTVTFPKGGVGAYTFASSNPGIVAVDGNGFISGVAEGSAEITVRTHNGKTAKATVKVTRSPAYVGMNAVYNLQYDQLSSSYSASYTLTLNPGDSYQLACEVEYGAYGDVVSFESGNPDVASVTSGGLITANAPGIADIVVRATGGSETVCRVSVTGGEPASMWYEAAEATLIVGQSAGIPALASSTLAAETLATAVYASSDPAVFTVAQAEDTGAWSITGVSVGTAVLVAGVGDSTASLNVTVVPAVPEATTPTYRLFAAYEYVNPDVKGYLPFPGNNAEGVATAFSQSSIAGLGYTTKIMGNPTKTALLSGISGFFSGTANVDVSIVYLCSHGHMTNGIAGYRMSLPGYDDSPENANYYLSSQEIFNCVSRINGNVVLILDSCYSGAFLEDMAGQLAAQGGRIAVMTAASDTRATYYNVKKTEKTVDFFTFFLLKGLGYNHRERWWNSNAAGKRGAYPGYLAADITGNGDGFVTLGEFYSYAENSIAANIPSYMKKSWYWGDRTRVQVPRFYAGGLTDLVIYQPK